jgi:hypothetical protein
MKKRELALIGAIILVLVLSTLFLALWQRKPKTPTLSENEVTISQLPKKIDLPLEVIEEFNAKVLTLRTPDLLLDFLNKNFTLEEGERKIAMEPEVFFHLKKGKAEDFAVFALYVLDFNRYESGILRYQAKDEKGLRTLVVFRDKDQPKYIYFEEGKAKIGLAGNSFDDLMKIEEKRIGKKILRYGAILKGNLDMTPKNWVERHKIL